MMARNLLESFKLLTNVSKLFAERCIDGLVANEERLRELAESSPSIVTPLNSAIGYEEAAAVAKQALKETQDDPPDGDRPRADRRQALAKRNSTAASTCWRWPRSKPGDS